MDRSAITRLLAGTVWALPEERYEALGDLIALAATQAGSELQAATRPPNRSSGATAVIPLIGTITQRADFFSMLFGGASTQAFSAMFRAALSDDRHP